MSSHTPIVSFTFDDFPSSALLIGGALLEQRGLAGTFYTSLGLMGRCAPTGEIFQRQELPLVIERGHELGCHTFAHCHAYDTPVRAFERSIVENQAALHELLPGAQFKTLSYPISCPRPGTKRRTGRYYCGCRAGGQTYNCGTMDLNNLRAFFIEQSRDNPQAIQAVIEANARAGGWLIFATHDVCASPTRYGCTPTLFERILDQTLNSGAQVLPVYAALQKLGCA
jgi:peptidoglycan/xylan/chitin deacetylase (PgdA/CDA1 family)